MELLAVVIEECLRQYRGGEFSGRFFYGKNSLMLGDGASGRTVLVSRCEDGSVRVLQRARDEDLRRVVWRFAEEPGYATDGATTLSIRAFSQWLQGLAI